MSLNMQLHPEEGVLRCYAWVASFHDNFLS